ncbi:hypothetical protein VSK91_07480 [Bacillus swezeyi]|uniref:Uncharacterized protein n=1 Tax=Bacillus swezeyi TaxID=1925020 RepID=A0A5M8RUT3_9BACI|nr:hypothetical protein [Bacillus swezeyi]KAA6450604.1 hypothetical protein DX927_06975 [Bacillus swezeyi]KAA6475220.1 hypothetical protein DX928_14640 [Bacillus swezeyi]TYS37139.1 hypothetical protein FZC77_06825 [Bacillus swezeyi]
MKRILQMTGIFLIAAAIILSGFMIHDVVYDPYMEDSQSMLFFTIGSYLSTPAFCIIGGFILLGISKLIELQEKNNAILAENLDLINQNASITAQNEAEHEENQNAQEPDRTIDADSFTLPAADDRKYWNG